MPRLGGNWVIGVITLVGFIAYLVSPPPFPFIQGDSQSFIDFTPVRTAAYPVFLKLVKMAFGDYRPAVYFQLGAMAASTGFLAHEIRATTKSTLLGALAAVLIFANVFVFRYAFSIMSEALFFSSLACVLAFACRYGRTRAAAELAWLSAAIGAAILIRPVAYAFLPALAACMVTGPGIRDLDIRKLAGAGLPVATLLVLGSAAYFAQHGSFRTQSFLGHNLIGKIAYVPGAGVKSDYPAIVERIDAAMARFRAIHVEDWRDRYLYRERHYDYVRFGLTTPLVEDVARRTSAPVDNIRLRVGLDFIRAHPGDYAADVALQAHALWQLADLRTPAEKARFDRRIRGLPFDPFEGMNFVPRAPAPAAFVYAVRFFLAGVFVVSILAIARAVGLIASRRPIAPGLFALAQASLILHAYILSVALIQFGHARYFMAMWPAFVTIAVLCLDLVPLRRVRQPPSQCPARRYL